MTDVKGYKPLSDLQKTSMNQVKDLETQILSLLRAIGESSVDADKRWIAIARTNLEQGFMAACRSIAQPETVEF